MRMSLMFSAAFTLATWQAIGATVTAVVGTILIISKDEDASLGFGPPGNPQDLPDAWLDLLHRLALVDLALALLLIVAIIETIRLNSARIRQAARIHKPEPPAITLQRLIALCAAGSLACGVGLILPPASVRKLATRGDPSSRFFGQQQYRPP